MTISTVICTPGLSPRVLRGVMVAWPSGRRLEIFPLNSSVSPDPIAHGRPQGPGRFRAARQAVPRIGHKWEAGLGLTRPLRRVARPVLGQVLLEPQQGARGNFPCPAVAGVKTTTREAGTAWVKSRGLGVCPAPEVCVHWQMESENTVGARVGPRGSRLLAKETLSLQVSSCAV